MHVTLSFFGILVFFKAAAALDFVEFLFHNQELCGNPFADAQWIPVLDTCDIECEPKKELCVEDDSMTQRCNKLPVECVDEWMRQQQKATTTSATIVPDSQSRVRPYVPNEALRPLPRALFDPEQLQHRHDAARRNVF